MGIAVTVNRSTQARLLREQNPSLTDVEIAERTGISVKEVREAMVRRPYGPYKGRPR